MNQFKLAAVTVSAAVTLPAQSSGPDRVSV